MPTLQNPLGSIMPDTHKARLTPSAMQMPGIALIEDDTYSALANRATCGRATAEAPSDLGTRPATSSIARHCTRFWRAGMRLAG